MLKQALRPRTKNDSSASGGGHTSHLQPLHPTTDTQSPDRLRRSGSIPSVIKCMLKPDDSSGARFLHSLCNTRAFFTKEFFFFFDTFELRFTTAVFCLTHFRYGWRDKRIKRHQPRRGMRAPPSQPHHLWILSCVVPDDVYTSKSKLKNASPSRPLVTKWMVEIASSMMSTARSLNSVLHILFSQWIPLFDSLDSAKSRFRMFDSI